MHATVHTADAVLVLCVRINLVYKQSLLMPP